MPHSTGDGKSGRCSGPGWTQKGFEEAGRIARLHLFLPSLSSQLGTPKDCLRLL